MVIPSAATWGYTVMVIILSMRFREIRAGDNNSSTGLVISRWHQSVFTVDILDPFGFARLTSPYSPDRGEIFRLSRRLVLDSCAQLSSDQAVRYVRDSKWIINWSNKWEIKMLSDRSESSRAWSRSREIRGSRDGLSRHWTAKVCDNVVATIFDNIGVSEDLSIRCN